MSDRGIYSKTEVKDFYLDLWVPPTVSAQKTDKMITISPKYHMRPELLSYDLYGTTDSWWVFMVRNPNKINDPINDFVSGLEIYIPSIV